MSKHRRHWRSTGIFRPTTIFGAAVLYDETAESGMTHAANQEYLDQLLSFFEHLELGGMLQTRNI